MNICVIIDAWYPVWGGGQTHVWEIATRMAKKSCTIDIYTRSLIDENGRIYSENESYKEGLLKIFRVGPLTTFFNTSARVFWCFIVCFHIWRSHRKTPYDIIHAHAYLSGFPAKVMSMFLSIPVVFTVHGSNNMDLNRKGIIPFFEKVLLTQIRYTQEISVSKHFLQYANVNRSIQIVPNGVDVNQFIGKFRKDKNVFTFLWVGRFDEIKGIDILLNSFSEVLKKNTKCLLLLVGSGQALIKNKKIVQKLKITNKVEFIDKQFSKKLISLYKKADAFVLPSLSEGFPITILEAWAAKLPVIASAVGDNDVLIKNGFDGFLVEPGNVSQLTNVILKLSYAKNRTIYGFRGYKKVKKYYSWNIAVKKMDRIYKKLYEKS